MWLSNGNLALLKIQGGVRAMKIRGAKVRGGCFQRETTNGRPKTVGLALLSDLGPEPSTWVLQSLQVPVPILGMFAIQTKGTLLSLRFLHLETLSSRKTLTSSRLSASFSAWLYRTYGPTRIQNQVVLVLFGYTQKQIQNQRQVGCQNKLAG